MRKIAKQAAAAIREKRNFKGKNTRVEYDSDQDTSYMYLFENMIMQYEHYSGRKLTRLAGYNTMTTRSRLNEVMRELGIEGYYTQRDFAAYFNGEEIDASSNQYHDV